MKPASNSIVLWRSAAPAAAAAVIFMIIAAVTGGNRKTVIGGGAIVGGITLVVTFGISIAISKRRTTKRSSRNP